MKKILLSVMVSAIALSACAMTKKEVEEKVPLFNDATVHDPSVIKVKDTFYVIGSHLQMAKSDDLMNWQQVNYSVKDDNTLIPNVSKEMADALAWAKTKTFWAGDMIQLEDGLFYMYYCNCVGDRPLACIGFAVSDQVDGPYKDLGILLKSGMSGAGEDGKQYDATVAPNCIDPHVFYDAKGELWMVYGSYSGGIFIMQMDKTTGRPLPNQGYGKKLLGKNHSRIEAPYILYSPESEYYYLFLSFGGLDAVGGYNMRVCRSKNPDGPYIDATGNDMINCGGAAGSFFDDDAIAPYGAKLMGNFQFNLSQGEDKTKLFGYVSPGHNSAYYDEETKQYFLIFHARFPHTGETHNIRVHQMFLNEDGWFVVAPHRYAEERIGKYKEKNVLGDYKFVNHGKDITKAIKVAETITLEDGKISGAVSGEWKLIGDNKISLAIDGQEYHGVFIRQYDSLEKVYVMSFTAMSPEGVSVWGSHVVQ